MTQIYETKESQKKVKRKSKEKTAFFTFNDRNIWNEILSLRIDY